MTTLDTISLLILVLGIAIIAWLKISKSSYKLILCVAAVTCLFIARTTLSYLMCLFTNSAMENRQHDSAIFWVKGVLFLDPELGNPLFKVVLLGSAAQDIIAGEIAEAGVHIEEVILRGYSSEKETCDLRLEIFTMATGRTTEADLFEAERQFQKLSECRVASEVSELWLAMANNRGTKSGVAIRALEHAKESGRHWKAVEKSAIKHAFVNVGERLARQGDFVGAREAFEAAQKHGNDVRMQLNALKFSRERIKDWSAFPSWLNIRLPDGERIFDDDWDGIADRAVYYKDDVEVAAGALTYDGKLRDRVVQLDHNRTVRIEFDKQGGLGGWFFNGPYLSHALIDVEMDSEPDWRLYADGSREPLHGTIFFCLMSAVIGGDADFFSLPDSYVIVHHGRGSWPREVGRTNVVSNSSFPVWNECVSIIYKTGDVVMTRFQDEDVFFDDHVDTLRWETMPSTGRYAGRKVALEVFVEPTTLPEGSWKKLMLPPMNVFQSPGPFTSAEWQVILDANKEQRGLETRKTVGTLLGKAALDAAVSKGLSMIFRVPG